MSNITCLTTIFPYIRSIIISGNSITVYAPAKELNLILNYLKLSSLTNYKQLFRYVCYR